MKLKVNSRQWLNFAAAVEANLLVESIRSKGDLVECPPARPGETVGEAKKEAMNAFLRWLALEQAEGRQLDGPPPPTGRGWDGHWAAGRTSKNAKTKATRQGIVDRS